MTFQDYKNLLEEVRCYKCGGNGKLQQQDFPLNPLQTCDFCLGTGLYYSSDFVEYIFRRKSPLE